MHLRFRENPLQFSPSLSAFLPTHPNNLISAFALLRAPYVSGEGSRYGHSRRCNATVLIGVVVVVVGLAFRGTSFD